MGIKINATLGPHRVHLVTLTAGAMVFGVLVTFGAASHSTIDNTPSRGLNMGEVHHAPALDYGCDNRMAPPPFLGEAEVTTIAVATDVSSNRDMIWLGEASGEYSIITITDATVFLDAVGSRATFDDIKTGMCIEVVGQVGKPMEVLAERIVILSHVWP